MRVLVVPADRTEPHGGPRNIGDAFLSDALASALELRGHQVDVYDFGSAERSTSGRGRLRGGRSRDLVRAIRRSDAVIAGGGTMLQDNAPEVFAGGLPRLCAVVAAFARATRRPLAFYGVGLDTIERPVSMRLVRFAVSGAPVWLRDADSVARFESYFGASPQLGADAALLADPQAPLSTTGEAKGRLTIALNRTEAAYLSGATVRRFAAGFDSVRFLSMDQEPGNADGDHLPVDVRGLLGHSAGVVGWPDALDCIGASTVVLASRMHALYMAMLRGIPAVAIGDRDKVVAFANEFGIPRLAEVHEYRRGDEGVADNVALEKARMRASESLDAMLDALVAGKR